MTMRTSSMGRMASTLSVAISSIFIATCVARSAEITVLSAVGMKEVMEDLGPKFERASGHTLAIGFGNLGAVVRRIQDGEQADVVILPGQGIDGLVKDGKARTDDRAVLARSGIGVAVRKGTPKPDISTPEAFKRALLAAKSVTYLDPVGGGTSGIHVARVLDHLGIVDEMKAKTVFHVNARAAGILVARGEAEIGINLIQELMPLPEIDVIGPLPADLQNTLVFSAVIMTGAREPLASKALVDFLRTPNAAAVIKAKGMEPG